MAVSQGVALGAQIAGSARAAPAAEAEEHFDDGDEQVEKMAPPVDPKGLPRGARRFSEKYSDDGNSSSRVRIPAAAPIPFCCCLALLSQACPSNGHGVFMMHVLLWRVSEAGHSLSCGNSHE